jgi:molybdate transport system regulatory protein
VKTKTPANLAAPLWLLFAGRELLMGKTMELLREIDAKGSLSKAANAVPISYKSAWDLIDKLNNISAHPVVTTATGGRGGGGTQLSDYGRTLVSLYGSLERTYESAFSALKDVNLEDVDHFVTLMKGMCMKTSARNQLAGTVKKATKGMVNSEILIDIGNAITISAVITNDSTIELGLKEGVEVIVLVKASAVLLFPGSSPVKTSIENMLKGVVAEIRVGIVNTEVLVTIPGSKTITSVVTKESVERLGIKVGDSVFAGINSSQVIIGLPA